MTHYLIIDYSSSLIKNTFTNNSFNGLLNLNISPIIKKYQSVYNLNCAYFIYKRYRVFLGKGVQYNFLDYIENIDSLGVIKLRIHFLKQIPAEGLFQWDFKNNQVPSKNTYFVPFNWVTQDVVFTSNTGLTRTSNNLTAQIFSINDKIISTVNEAIPAQAFTSIIPAILVDQNGTIYGPKFDSDTQTPLISNVSDTPLCVKNNTTFDYLIVYPEFKTNTIFKSTAISFQEEKAGVYKESHTSANLDPTVLYYGIDMPRIYQTNTLTTNKDFILNFQSEQLVGNLTNLFIGKKALIGNNIQSCAWSTDLKILQIFDKISSEELFQSQVEIFDNINYKFLETGNKWYYVIRKSFYRDQLTYYPNSYCTINRLALTVYPPDYIYTRTNGDYIKKLDISSWILDTFIGDLIICEWSNKPKSEFLLVPTKEYNSYCVIKGDVSTAEPIKSISDAKFNDCYKPAFENSNLSPATSGWYKLNIGNFCVGKLINYGAIGWDENHLDETNQDLYNWTYSSMSENWIKNAKRIIAFDTEALNIGFRTTPDKINSTELNSFIFKCDKLITISFTTNSDNDWELDNYNWYRLKNKKSWDIDTNIGNFTKCAIQLIGEKPSISSEASYQDRRCCKLSTAMKIRNTQIPLSISNKARDFIIPNKINSLSNMDFSFNLKFQSYPQTIYICLLLAK